MRGSVICLLSLWSAPLVGLAGGEAPTNGVSLAGTNGVRVVMRRGDYQPPDPPTGHVSSVFAPPLGTYQYEITWRDREVMSAQLVVDRTGDLYRVKLQARSIRSLESVYELRYRGEARLDAGDYSPVDALIRERRNSREKQSVIAFKPGGWIESVILKRKEDELPRRTDVLIPNEGLTFDPFSAAFLVRSLDWQPGRSVAFEVTDGRALHLLTLTCKRRTTRRILGQDRPVWVLEPLVSRIDTKDPELATNAVAAAEAALDDEDADTAGLKAELYLTADEARELVGASGSSKTGEIRVRLERFVPTPAAADGGVRRSGG